MSWGWQWSQLRFIGSGCGRQTAHLKDITNTAQQLLISFEYNQHAMDGSSFFTGPGKVASQYSDSHFLAHLQSIDVPAGLKETCKTQEHLWRLYND